MKKLIILISLIPIFNFFLNGNFWEIKGTRSCGLGGSTRGFSFDLGAPFSNPALSSTLPFSYSGYQFHRSGFDFNDFNKNINEILKYDLNNINGLSKIDNEALRSRLNSIYSGNYGICGNNYHVTSFVGQGLSFAYAKQEQAIINPNFKSYRQSGELLNQKIINDLDFNYTGLSLSHYNISYALQISHQVSLGVGLNYYHGKLTKFNSSIIQDSILTKKSSMQGKIGELAGRANEKFKGFAFDFGLSYKLNDFFRAAVVLKNFGSPSFKTDSFVYELPKRIIAAVAFTPTDDWGIYIDSDLKKKDLYMSGKEILPIAIGVERAFFSKTMFLRLGLSSDLNSEKILGKGSDILYSMGLGFSFRPVLLDCSIIMDNESSINTLSLALIYIIR